jgi:hypothetical protein
MISRHTLSSWPGLSRPSTPFIAARKTWMPGTRFTIGPAEGRTRWPGMTKVGDIAFGEVDR